MRTRQLGTTDLHVTTVGLGTWAIGGPWDWGWGPQSDADSLRTIDEALDAGINWIDTAPCYGLGHSETVVGQALRGRRDQVIVATKCGLVWDDPASRVVYGRLTAASVRAECEASLRRLGTDRIDLYQVHWPDPDAEIEQGWAEIARLVGEGKVRYAGVSNFSPAQVRRAIHPVASHQPPYSMLERGIEAEVTPLCIEEQIGIIAYSPMQAGLLTGAFSAERLAGLPADDWRRKSRHFQGSAFKRNLALVDGLRPIAARLGCSLAELAVAWAVHQPGITAAIVAGFAAGGDLALDAATLAEIRALLP